MSESVRSSVKSSVKEFKKNAEDWLDAFPIADHKQRTNFFYTFKNALKILHYFEVMQGRVTVKNSPMLSISGAFYVVKRHEDLVMLDLETVWNQYIVSGGRARHSFTTTDAGFDMLFAVTPSNNYVLNGVLKVTAKRG